MALSVSTQSPDGMSNIAEGQVRVSVWVDVPKANKQEARIVLMAAAAVPEAVDREAAETLLLQYSEWLDTEKINPSNPDLPTHEDLVRSFLASRGPNWLPKLED